MFRVSASSQRSRETGRLALWFGLAGAPLAWSAQTLLTYSVAAYACFPRGEPRRAPLFALGVVLGLIALAALLLAIGALGTSIRSLRRSRANPISPNDPKTAAVGDRIRFMALAGLLVSAIFLVAVLSHAIVLVLVPPCG